MDWRIKAYLQGAFSTLPGGHNLNYLFQRYLTKALPAPETVVEAMAATALTYVDRYVRVTGRNLSEAVFYEFGAGVDLIVPLTLYSAGVERQIVVDIRPLARPSLVGETVARLRAGVRPGTVRVPAELPQDGAELVHGLERMYGIRYMAPADARATGLDPASVDCVTSTNTLEHIPPDDIGRILLEARRLIHPQGLLISQVDYQDHYSYFDPTISVYNYLRFSDARWRRYSPALQFQNRLRHSQYLELFAANGWEVLEDGASPVSDEDLELLKGTPVDARFASFDSSDLAVRTAVIVARPAA